MTTHEFAEILLKLPNIGIVVPKVIEYDDNPDDSCADPVINITAGRDENENMCNIAVITYEKALD